MFSLPYDRQQGAGAFGITALGVCLVQGGVIRFLRVCNRAMEQFPALARRFILQ